jgi:hypothetical protein
VEAEVAAELTYRNETARMSRTDWGAIWAGLFTFVAIWSVFGLLGMTLFGNAANPGTTNPNVTGAMGFGAGMDIWAVVLTIIAMYVAGRATAHLAAVEDRRDAVLYGMVVFGLSIAAVILLVIIGAAGMNGSVTADGGTHIQSALNTFVSWGWSGFIALFFGWLAAMAGALSGAVKRTKPERSVQPIRPAA